ncbi:MAG TPA: hypothetical protein VNM50_05520, partial [Chloroflexota bacterium]|nr:hypothetical protein [Chloroflexota bacterium]
MKPRGVNRTAAATAVALSVLLAGFQLQVPASSLAADPSQQGISSRPVGQAVQVAAATATPRALNTRPDIRVPINDSVLMAPTATPGPTRGTGQIRPDILLTAVVNPPLGGGQPGSPTVVPTATRT